MTLSTALGTAVLPSAGDSPGLFFHLAKHTRGNGRRQLSGAGKVEGGERSPLGPSTSRYTGVEGGRPATALPIYPGVTVGHRQVTWPLCVSLISIPQTGKQVLTFASVLLCPLDLYFH